MVCSSEYGPFARAPAGLDCIIPAAKRPSALGDASNARTNDAPAEEPKIVIREGSPPNALTFRFTHFNAVIAS